MPDDRAANVQADELTVLAKDTTNAETAAPPPPPAPPADSREDSGNLQSAQTLGAVQYGTLLADGQTFAGEAPNQIDTPAQIASDFVGVPGSGVADSAGLDAAAAIQIAQAGAGGTLDQPNAAQGNAAPGAQIRAAGVEAGAPNVAAGATTQNSPTAGTEAPAAVAPGQAVDGPGAAGD
ncbi:MAG: hypothetical protein NBV67_10785, partial [Tagaea sp.]|nr:hypothetical protein [Tagaea sp.]